MTAHAQPDRDARLEARLAAYTRYAATVAEQFSAALHGDAVRAGAICAERELLGEHYAELCERGPAGAAPAFDAMLADAIVELDHQVGIELALRQRIAVLRDEALRVLHEGGDVPGGLLPSTGIAAATALAALDPADVSAGALGAIGTPHGPAAPPKARGGRGARGALPPAAPRLNVRG